MTGIERLRDPTPAVKVFVAATGAGAGVQQALWAVPGSSAFLAGAAFPYARHEVEKFLGFTPARFCDEETAVELAIAAYVRAREVCFAEAPAGGRVAAAVGLGLTASVASLSAHQGDHRVFAASVGERGAVVWSAVLRKGAGADVRARDGGLADRLALHALLQAAGVGGAEMVRDLDVPVSRRVFDESELTALLFRRPAFCAGERTSLTPADAGASVLLPGSFAPFHAGHLMMAEAVEQQVGKRVVFTITAEPVHKARLRAVELLDRVASVRSAGGASRTTVLTREDPLFIDKARQFPGAAIALGVDAVIRMLDPVWGPDVATMLNEFRALGTRFLVLVASSTDGGRPSTMWLPRVCTGISSRPSPDARTSARPNCAGPAVLPDQFLALTWHNVAPPVVVA